MHICIYINVYAYMYIHKYVCMYIYIYIYIKNKKFIVHELYFGFFQTFERLEETEI